MATDINGLKMKIAELGEAVNQSLPGYVGILAQIHKEMQSQPELIYMLDDAEIAMTISGLSKLHKVEIVDVKEKKPVSKTRGASLSSDDV